MKRCTHKHKRYVTDPKQAWRETTDSYGKQYVRDAKVICKDCGKHIDTVTVYAGMFHNYAILKEIGL